MLEEKRLKSPPTCTNTKRDGQNVFRAPMFRVALSNDIV